MTWPVLLAVALLVSVALLGFTEVALRIVERRLPMYMHWHDKLTTGKWVELHHLRREAPVDVVVAGSSQMLTAFDPTAVPFRCYNAGLYRGVPTVMAEWLRDEVLPATRPRLVAWGLSILDLNDNGTFHSGVLERYSGAPARRGGRLVHLRRRFALVRRLPMLLHPRRTRSLVRSVAASDPTSNKPLSALLGPMGKGVEYEAATEYRLSPDKEQFVRTEIIGGFAMGGAQIDAVRRGAAAIRAAGADLMLIEVPCTEEFVQMYPNGKADLDAAGALLRALADELGVPFVPVSDELPLDWFYDAVHLNGIGMRHWTAQLAPVVATALDGVQLPRPAMSGATIR
jgi:hypothetical protein